jgi:hypothetical protein
MVGAWRQAGNHALRQRINLASQAPEKAWLEVIF